MRLRGQIFLLPFAQQHQFGPLPFKLGPAVRCPEHNPLSMFTASLGNAFVDARVQFFKFPPRRNDVERFAQSRLSNNAFPDVGAAVDVFNQLSPFVRCHALNLIVWTGGRK